MIVDDSVTFVDRFDSNKVYYLQDYIQNHKIIQSQDRESPERWFSPVPCPPFSAELLQCPRVRFCLN